MDLSGSKRKKRTGLRAVLLFTVTAVAAALIAAPAQAAGTGAGLLAIRYAGGGLAAWNGTGGGGFTYAGDLGSGWDAYHNLTAVGDISGDGRADLVAVRNSDGNLARWYGTSGGGYAFAGDHSSGWNSYDQLTGGSDFTGDGRPDLLAVRYADGALAQWKGTGSGGFTYLGIAGSGWDAYYNLNLAGDITGDGRADLVAVRDSDGHLARWKGNGSGGFAFIGDYGGGWESYDQLASNGDITGDGRPDLVAVRWSDGHLARWKGTGSGGFAFMGDAPGGGWDAYRDLVMVR